MNSGLGAGSRHFWTTERIGLEKIIGHSLKVRQLLETAEDARLSNEKRDRALLKALFILDEDLRRFVGLRTMWDSMRPRPESPRWRIPWPTRSERLDESELISEVARALSRGGWPEDDAYEAIENLVTAVNTSFHSSDGNGIAVHVARPIAAVASARATGAYEAFYLEAQRGEVTKKKRRSAARRAKRAQKALGLLVAAIVITDQGPRSIQNVASFVAEYLPNYQSISNHTGKIPTVPVPKPTNVDSGLGYPLGHPPVRGSAPGLLAPPEGLPTPTDNTIGTPGAAPSGGPSTPVVLPDLPSQVERGLPGRPKTGPLGLGE